MRAESMRMDRLTRRRQVVAWRREDLRNTATMLNSFRNDITEHTGSRSAINNPTRWNTMQASITGSAGNTNGVTVTATNKAKAGSFDFQVLSVAAGDFVRGNQQFNGVAAGAVADFERSLSNHLNLDMGFFLARSTVGGADGQAFRNNANLFNINHYEYVQIGDAEIRINYTDTAQDIMDRVNRTAAANVKMSFDTMRGVFTIESTKTGADAIVRTGNDRMGFLEHIGLANIRNAAAGNTLPPGMSINPITGAITGTAPSSTITTSSSILGNVAGIVGNTFDLSLLGGNGTFVMDANTSFHDLMNAINTDPNSDSTLSFANGRFTVMARNTATAIQTGDGTPNALLDFMGLNNIDIPANRAHIGVTAAAPTVNTNTDDQTTIFSLLNPPPTASVNISIGGLTITVNNTTTIAQFLAEVNGGALNVPNPAFDPQNPTAEPEFLPSAPSDVVLALNPDGTNTISAREIDGIINISSSPQGNRILSLFGINDALRTEINRVNAPAFVNGTEAVTHARNARISDSNPSLVGESITINGRDFTITASDTFQSFMDRINNATINPTTPFGVVVSLNDATGQFTIRPSTLNDDAKIQTNSSALAQFMGLANIDWAGNASHNYVFDHANSDHRLVQRAKDALIRYTSGPHGYDPVELKQASNTFELEALGVRIDITSAALSTTGTPNIISVDIKQNVDDVMDMIREFVDSYNKLIRELHTLQSTARPTQRGSRNFFEPLTEEQRKAMSDKEVEQWEDQARMGMLHRDPMIRNLQSEIRRVMFDPVTLSDGSKFALFNVGITTAGLSSDRSDFLAGVLQIDEDILRRHLMENPEKVQALFSRDFLDAGEGIGNAKERADSLPNIGVAWRLRHIIDNQLGISNPSAGSPFLDRVGALGWDDGQNIMSRQLRDYDERIERMQQFLIRRENHFFNMFARMEQAMAQSHQQMDSLFAFGNM
jgi:flagellar capping protein FliD